MNITTGAYTIDDVDLTLPGPFPLQLGRNYSSQNPLLEKFGCRMWMENDLNPLPHRARGRNSTPPKPMGPSSSTPLTKRVGRWEVTPEENPKALFQTPNNLYHNYIEGEILYGADGSRRIFEEGLLKPWINPQGAALTFSYTEVTASPKIQNSYGDFCAFHYNHEGKISEIHATRDGRRSLLPLRRTAKPHTESPCPSEATISYTYDRLHQIIQETKPHGKILENTYDDEGRVIRQRSPLGPAQQMTTTATFTYQGKGSPQSQMAKGGPPPTSSSKTNPTTSPTP